MGGRKPRFHSLARGNPARPHGCLQASSAKPAGFPWRGCCKNLNGVTCLAAHQGHIDICRLLVESGADLEGAKQSNSCKALESPRAAWVRVYCSLSIVWEERQILSRKC